MEKEKQIVPNWVLLATAVFAFVAMADLPYGYYRLLRWIVCAVAIASAVQLHRGQRQGLAWVLGAVALLFNPIIPVPLGKASWRVFDGAAGVAFLGVLYLARKDRHRDTNQVRVE
jgi:hypothetical protein